MVEPPIDQVWECPRCEAQVGMGTPGQLKPPTCQMGHPPVEMEQKRPEALRHV